MNRVSTTWGVRQSLTLVLLLVTASAGAVAHPRLFVPKLGVTGIATVQAAPNTPQAQPAPGTSNAPVVIMKGVRFQPPELSVRPGETVEFKNEDMFAHTVTASDGSFDSGLIQPGTSWKLTMPKHSVSFHCAPHPNMHGKLVAVSAGPEQTQSSAGDRLPGFNPPSRPFELHPILVNFTAALLPLAFASDLLGRFLNRRSLNNAGAWMVLYAALITPLTAAAGWWWKSKSAGALPPNVIAVHQWLGTSLGLVFIVLAVWRWRFQKRDEVPSFGYLALTAVSVLALVYQGSLGGLMVFGK
jgi:uncharacterized membrane protein/plastocyanin